MTRAGEHGRGGGPREEPLTPDDTPGPTHAERARTLASGRSVGALATVALDPAGFPYGSHVTYAMDGPDPVFLVSRMAAHTKHLEADPRASLLVVEPTEKNPLAIGRVTLVGECRRVEGDESSSAREAFLGAHPDAAFYERFTDFGFFRLRVDAVRYIGGFGRMSWVSVDAWRAAAPDPMAPHAADIIAHMNDDHADALVAYARAFTRATDAEEVVMTGVDRYGFEMSVRTESGPRPARLAFEAPIATPTEARQALVRLVKDARARLAKPR
ncbi:MAG: HugZ family protein [Sandaracinaceae bacterium]|nr:HugZ family protein [Sandaracinaceae bacterium]